MYQQRNKDIMKNFNQLMNESNGNFTVEPNEFTEIHVSVENSNVVIEVYPFKNHMKGVPTQTILRSGLLFLGGESLEDIYNRVINNL